MKALQEKLERGEDPIRDQFGVKLARHVRSDHTPTLMTEDKQTSATTIEDKHTFTPPFDPFADGVITRGDIVLVDLMPVRGHEKDNGKDKHGQDAPGRPCIIVQNDKGNRFSTLTIVVLLTDIENYNPKMDVIQVRVEKSKLGATASKDGVVECGHIRTISKERIIKKLGRLPTDVMTEIDKKLKNSLALT